MKKTFCIALALLVLMPCGAMNAGCSQAGESRPQASPKEPAAPPKPPKFSDILNQVVVFIYEDVQPYDQAKMQGTGFIVGIPISDQSNAVIPFIVTAKHVVAGKSSVAVRFSPASGTSPVFLSYNLDELRKSNDVFEHSDQGVDVIAFRTQSFDQAKMNAFPISLIASKDVFKGQDIDVMDRVMLPALMTRFPGTTQNYPVFRDGSIALLAEEPIPFIYPINGKPAEIKQQALLINATVNPGFSGAPVFLWPGPRSTKTSAITLGTNPWLLGVIGGFFPQLYPVKDQNGNPVTLTFKGPSILDAPQQISLFTEENSAIGFATPSWRILELFDTTAAKKRIAELFDIAKKERK